MSWRRTNIFRKRFTNEMSLQNIKERKKKRSRHTKYYQKTSKFVWYQPFSALNNSNFFSPFFSFSFFFVLFFCFLLLLFVDFFFSPKTRYGAERKENRRRNEQRWSDIERQKKKKKKNRSTENKEERSSTTAKNWNMLYTTSESTRTNTSPAKRQILQIKDK